MDISALQLESRFSLPPNSLGYCGRNTAPEKFKKCIINGICDGVEKEVTKFIVLYPYLKTISQFTGLSPFSYPVIESYWLGNNELKKAGPSHYLLLLDLLLKQGVPDFFIEELRQKPPKAFIPSHLFHVLHVGVGKASGAVPFNLESINNCMVRWGKIININKNKAVINLHSLEIKNEKYSLTSKKEEIPFRTRLVGQIKTGTTAAVHWNMLVKILSSVEEKKLKFWTKECLSLF